MLTKLSSSARLMKMRLTNKAHGSKTRTTPGKYITVTLRMDDRLKLVEFTGIWFNDLSMLLSSNSRSKAELSIRSITDGGLGLV